MSRLDELITIAHRNVRSVNIEQDLGSVDVLAGYSPGTHVVDAVRRVTIALQDDARNRAWSITGPYGAGKSSFAHFLCSLLGPAADPATELADTTLRTVDRQLADALITERERLDVQDSGLLISVAAAQREPAATTVARALTAGADRFFARRRKPPVLKQLRALQAAAETGQQLDPEALLAALEQLLTAAPVLLVLDELGKNLEFAAEGAVEGDLFLLQQIAERFSTSDTMQGGIVTMQHLAFEDYLVGVSETRRREWRKVQGRFEDVAFIGGELHALRLIADTITAPADKKTRAKLTATSTEAIDALLTAAPRLTPPAALSATNAALYPLHPTAVLALPQLAARYGQNDRSLIAFLTSDAPHGLREFLANNELAAQPPFLRLTSLYDYFVEGNAATPVGGADGALLREVRARIEEAQDLDEHELAVLKTVAVLNLVTARDGLVAAPDIVSEALAGPAASRRDHERTAATLTRLDQRGLLTFRDFAGEYRVWQGSDFDVGAHVAAAREQLEAFASDDEAELERVAAVRPLRPAVARRHSQKHDVLRYFETVYATEPPDGEVRCQHADADGLVVYVLGHGSAPKRTPAETADGKPLLVVWSPHGRLVFESGLDAAATVTVLQSAPELETDPVARREVRHRVAVAQATLSERIDAAFEPGREGVVWFVTGRRRPAASGREFSKLLSTLCDKRYPQTPVLHNEMLNRRELTSQGAKARRELLEAMFEHSGEPRLGIDDWGPQRSMYEAVLHATGLHGEHGEEHRFGPPPADSSVASVWRFIEDWLDAASDQPRNAQALYDELMAPPYGMRAGAVPVLLAAALIYRHDDVFVYQDGTFLPVLGAPDFERLIKTPERFAFKRASLLGIRSTVFRELETIVGDGAPTRARTRNATTLAIVRPLIASINALPPFSVRTAAVSDTAKQVREALMTSREPDELLFTTLPAACGLKPFAAGGGDTRRARVYSDRLREALTELGSAYELLLAAVTGLIREAFRVPKTQRSLREDLRARSRHLVEQVIDPRMRAFLLAAANADTTDREWTEAVAMNIATKPPANWTDRDRDLFESALAERARWFIRLEALHYDKLPDTAAGFRSRRVTVTAPEGEEVAEVVSFDENLQATLERSLDDTLADLLPTLGTEAERQLLGVLAERLLTGRSARTNSPPDLQEVRRRESA